MIIEWPQISNNSCSERKAILTLTLSELGGEIAGVHMRRFPAKPTTHLERERIKLLICASSGEPPKKYQLGIYEYRLLKQLHIYRVGAATKERIHQ